jgi:hypothetical protein
VNFLVHERVDNLLRADYLVLHIFNIRVVEILANRFEVFVTLEVYPVIHEEVVARNLALVELIASLVNTRASWKLVLFGSLKYLVKELLVAKFYTERSGSNRFRIVRVRGFGTFPDFNVYRGAYGFLF